MTILAVVAAVAAPWIRSLPVDRQMRVATAFGVVLLAGLLAIPVFELHCWMLRKSLGNLKFRLVPAKCATSGYFGFWLSLLSVVIYLVLGVVDIVFGESGFSLLWIGIVLFAVWGVPGLLLQAGWFRKSRSIEVRQLGIYALVRGYGQVQWAWPLVSVVFFPGRVRFQSNISPMWFEAEIDDSRREELQQVLKENNARVKIEAT